MKTITIIFIGAAVVLIAVYDVIALLRGGGAATISSIIIHAIYANPWGLLIVLALGVLIGHLIWAQPRPQ